MHKFDLETAYTCLGIVSWDADVRGNDRADNYLIIIRLQGHLLPNTENWQSRYTANNKGQSDEE